MTKTISGDSAALAGAAGPSKESPGKPEQGSSRRIDPRLAEALRISYAASADEPDWEGVAALAFATEPGASLLADAVVARAIAVIPDLTRLERRNGRWRVFRYASIEAMDDERWLDALSRPTLLEAIAAALGDET